MLSSNTAGPDFLDLSGITFEKRTLSSAVFSINSVFVFLLLRVKFSTEKDAARFALKVSSLL